MQKYTVLFFLIALVLRAEIQTAKEDDDTLSTLLFTALLLDLLQSSKEEPPKQIPAKTTQSSSELAEAVREEFLHSWSAYKRYAWGHDELKPISKSYHDWYEKPLMITMVDALDSLWIMGFKEEAREAEKYITKNLSFDVSMNVQVFEVSIRLLGGLLSAYSISSNKQLLELATDLANRLLPAFDSPTGIPYRFVNLKTGEKSIAVTNPAEAGSFSIEFGILTRLTGNPIYYQVAKKAQKAIFERRLSDGLVVADIHAETGKWLSEDKHLGGGVDSYVEYLFKAHALFEDIDCLSMWNQMLTSIKGELIERSGKQTRLSTKTSSGLNPFVRSLETFIPGLFAISGELDIATELVDTYYNIWKEHEGMPEFTTLTLFGREYSRYPLRPELIESLFYVYYAKNDAKYLEMAATIFQDIVKNCRLETGYVGLENLNNKKNKIDLMDSYFLSETLKYLYLIFSEKGQHFFKHHVFSTEGHPFLKNMLVSSHEF